MRACKHICIDIHLYICKLQLRLLSILLLSVVLAGESPFGDSSPTITIDTTTKFFWWANPHSGTQALLLLSTLLLSFLVGESQFGDSSPTITIDTTTKFFGGRIPIRGLKPYVYYRHYYYFLVGESPFGDSSPTITIDTTTKLFWWANPHSGSQALLILSILCMYVCVCVHVCMWFKLDAKSQLEARCRNTTWSYIHI